MSDPFSAVRWRTTGDECGLIVDPAGHSGYCNTYGQPDPFGGSGVENFQWEGLNPGTPREWKVGITKDTVLVVNFC